VKRMHIMFDLETMGMPPNGAIASIGAVLFDPFSEELGETFYQIVDLAGQEKEFKRSINGDTVTWWMQQSEAARKELIRGDRVRLPTMLNNFSRWVGTSSRPMWAYPSTFDHAILQSAYDVVGIKNPVHWRDHFCMRGLAKLAHVEPVAYKGEAHNALDDAVFQAKWLQQILSKKWVRS
jgi:hypothetical protein